MEVLLCDTQLPHPPEVAGLNFPGAGSRIWHPLVQKRGDGLGTNTFGGGGQQASLMYCARGRRQLVGGQVLFNFLGSLAVMWSRCIRRKPTKSQPAVGAVAKYMTCFSTVVTEGTVVRGMPYSHFLFEPLGFVANSRVKDRWSRCDEAGRNWGAVAGGVQSTCVYVRWENAVSSVSIAVV